jgi:CHAD domain-containing protein
MPPRKDRVSRLFQKVTRQLSRLDSQAQPDDIHHFRTAARRVETLLELLQPDPDRNQRKLLKQLSKARRRAGRVRDLDVQMAALHGLKAPEQPRIKTEVLQTLSEMRAKRNQRLLKSLDRETVRDLRRRLKRAEDHVRENVDVKPLIERRLSAFLSDTDPADEKLLHQYRIDGKKIRYLAELSDESPETQLIIDELRRMQNALGEWHDWLTLNSTLLKLLPDLENSPLLSAVRNISNVKYREAVQAVANTKTTLATKPTIATKPAAPKRTVSSGQPVAASAVA